MGGLEPPTQPPHARATNDFEHHPTHVAHETQIAFRGWSGASWHLNADKIGIRLALPRLGGGFL